MSQLMVSQYDLQYIVLTKDRIMARQRFGKFLDSYRATEEREAAEAEKELPFDERCRQRSW